MNNTDNDGKKRQMEWARKMWLVLVPILAILVLFMLFNWWRGEDKLTVIFSPLALMFVGLSTLFSTKNKVLQYIFLVLGMIFVVTGLIFLFIY